MFSECIQVDAGTPDVCFNHFVGDALVQLNLQHQMFLIYR